MGWFPTDPESQSITSSPTLFLSPSFYSSSFTSNWRLKFWWWVSSIQIETWHRSRMVYLTEGQHNSIFLGRSASGPIGPPLFHFYSILFYSNGLFRNVTIFKFRFQYLNLLRHFFESFHHQINYGIFPQAINFLSDFIRNPSCAIENIKTVSDFNFYKFKLLSLGIAKPVKG
jgi:hypothetical protein